MEILFVADSDDRKYFGAFEPTERRGHQVKLPLPLKLYITLCNLRLDRKQIQPGNEFLTLAVACSPDPSGPSGFLTFTLRDSYLGGIS